MPRPTSRSCPTHSREICLDLDDEAARIAADMSGMNRCVSGAAITTPPRRWLKLKELSYTLADRIRRPSFIHGPLAWSRRASRPSVSLRAGPPKPTCGRSSSGWAGSWGLDCSSCPTRPCCATRARGPYLSSWLMPIVSIGTRAAAPRTVTMARAATRTARARIPQGHAHELGPTAAATRCSLHVRGHLPRWRRQ